MQYVFYALSILSGFFIALRQNWYGSWNALWQIPLACLCVFLALVILFLLVLIISTRFVSRKHTFKRPAAFFRFLINGFCKLAFSIGGVRVHASGLDRVPKGTRYLLVSNHLFAFDPLLFFYCLPQEEFSFISKKENYALFLVPELMHATMCLPIDRENDRAALHTILKAISYLKENRTSIAVFPEGGTSKSGKLQAFRNGVFKIAQKAEVPIVVCTVRNTRQIPKNLFRRRTDVYLDIHTVIPASALCNVTTVEIGGQIHAIMENALMAQN